MFYKAPRAMSWSVKLQFILSPLTLVVFVLSNFIMAHQRFLILAFALLSCLVRSVAGDTCSEVASTTSIEVKTALDLQYTEEQQHYWSTGCGALQPSCQLYPTTANEVAAIVKILNSNNETFVVKSGGHNPNQGFASIQGGPLISTRELNEVTFDPSTMTVRAGPGNRWEDVHAALQNTGVTVVGGRIGNVGVGGYVLGGGLSFLSTEYGWAANNIVEYEIVLANASIITASSTEHPDLYKALKGGLNNYGIVTAYTMVAHPQGQVSAASFPRRCNSTRATLVQSDANWIDLGWEPRVCRQPGAQDARSASRLH